MFGSRVSMYSTALPLSPPHYVFTRRIKGPPGLDGWDPVECSRNINHFRNHTLSSLYNFKLVKC